MDKNRISEFISNVCQQYKDSGKPITKDITDEIFCLIESDRKLLNNYLDILCEGNSTSLKSVNSSIAQSVAEFFNLTNNGVENKHPKSKLIQGYHELIKN